MNGAMINVIGGASPIVDKLLSYSCVKCILLDRRMIVCHRMDDWSDEFFDMMAYVITEAVPLRVNANFSFWR